MKQNKSHDLQHKNLKHKTKSAPKPKIIIHDNKKIHESVGAVIIRNKKVLMINRANYPYGWACPAGHVDAGEKPDTAVVREVKEETGLNITFAKEVMTEFVEWNDCVYGVKGHLWHVYIATGEGEVKINKEVKDWAWKTLTEIEQLSSNNKLEPVWAYWFKKIRNVRVLDFIDSLLI